MRLTEQQLTLLSQITNGVHDNMLPEIVNALNGRRSFLAAEKADKFFVGQTVRINRSCRPAYMRGHEVVIVKMTPKRATVALVHTAGRFVKGDKVKCPYGILEAK